MASGQAAETLAILNLAEAGDHIVSSPSLYGGTYNLFHYTLPKLGIEVTFVDDPDDLDAVASRGPAEHQGVLRRDASATRSNDVLDIEGVAGVAHDNGVPLIVDNTVADAVPDPPARVGRRHRRALGHQVHRRPRHVDRRRRSSTAARSTSAPAASSRSFTEPDPSYHGLAYWPALGPGAYIIKARVQLLRDIGAASRRSTRSCSSRASRR